jgi:hypothetical protein
MDAWLVGRVKRQQEISAWKLRRILYNLEKSAFYAHYPGATNDPSPPESTRLHPSGQDFVDGRRRAFAAGDQ